jgi:hypothetical protein
MRIRFALYVAVVALLIAFAVPVGASALSRSFTMTDGTLSCACSHNYVTISGNTTKWLNTTMYFKYVGGSSFGHMYIRLFGSGQEVWYYDNLYGPSQNTLYANTPYTKSVNIKTYRDKTFSSWQLWVDPKYAQRVTATF